MPSVSPRSESRNAVAPIRVPGWSGFEWLWHGFSTRAGGVSEVYLPPVGGQVRELGQGTGGELNLGFTPDDNRDNARENRLRFVEAVAGSRETPLTLLRQIHSNRSVSVDGSGEWVAPEADGIMTNRPGVLVGVQTADCIPVLVADPLKRAVGAFHAGWRGTVERIVELGVARMTAEFGSDPAALVAAIGPGIGPCCYTVGEEVRTRFQGNFRYADGLFSDGNAVGSDSGLRLDLIGANRRQLLDAGMKPGAISVVGGCTSCQPDLFYSHRASGGRAGRMMAVAGIRPSTALRSGA